MYVCMTYTCMCVCLYVCSCVGQVLVALPKLERLDKEEFTEDERADAEEVGVA